MPYTENPLPELGTKLGVFRVVTNREIDEALRLRKNFREEAYEKDGALLWKSNDRCVPKSCFADAYCTPSQQHLDTEARQTDAFLADYRKRMENYVHSDEEMFEMRAAFGPGAKVVNAITGKVTQL